MTTIATGSSQRKRVPPGRSVWAKLDDYLGRGSFRWLRRYLPPGQEYCQFAYAGEIAALPGPGARWLDGGCGRQVIEPRLHDEELALAGRARLAAGCDAYLPALAKHRSLPNLVCCLIERLPSKDNAFDLVTLNMVVEHLQQPEIYFNDLARIVDRDGHVLLLTPNAGSYYVFLIRLGWRIVPIRWGLKMVRYIEHREPEYVFPAYYQANTIRRIRSLMRRHGFVEEKIVPIAYRPRLCLFLSFAVAELIFMRLLWGLGFKGIVASTILCVYWRISAEESLDRKHAEVEAR